GARRSSTESVRIRYTSEVRYGIMPLLPASGEGEGLGERRGVSPPVEVRWTGGRSPPPPPSPLFPSPPRAASPLRLHHDGDVGTRLALRPFALLRMGGEGAPSPLSYLHQASGLRNCAGLRGGRAAGGEPCITPSSSPVVVSSACTHPAGGSSPRC